LEIESSQAISDKDQLLLVELLEEARWHVSLQPGVSFLELALFFLDSFLERTLIVCGHAGSHYDYVLYYNISINNKVLNHNFKL